jgi:3-oxoadipate enol-lactonase
MMDAASAHVLDRRGSRLHYRMTGPADGPLVAFSHGATLDHEMFEPQVGPLAAAGYRVLTWDMRGHGLSKPMGVPFSLQVAAGDLVAVLDAVEAQRAFLVGHSFGGFVSQDVVHRHPDRVRALVVIGCTDLAGGPARGMQVAARVLPRVLPLFSVDAFRNRTVQDLSTRDDVRRYGYAATGRLSKDEYLTVIMAGVECLAAAPGVSSGSTIPRPFLLTHGADDRANRGVAAKRAPTWAAKEPNCTYHVVPDAGHTANLDNPEAFNALLLDFLAQHAERLPHG